MTKEEAKEILISTLRDINSNDNSFEYTTEQFTEAMLIAIESLSNPSLPSNLDEAVEKSLDDIFGKGKHQDFYVQLFKAGAEWMAGQYTKIEGELVDWYETNGVDYCCGIRTNESFEVPEGFYFKKK